MVASEHLDALYAAGRRQWPALAACLETFASLVTDDSKLDHAGDLYLAAACAAGQREALLQFRERYEPQLRAIIGALGVPDDVRQEASQRLATRLFVASEDSPARISAYHARGPLLAFLRVAAVRQVQELVRKRHGRVELSEDVLDGVAGPASDPELAYLKKLYRQEFNRAFAAAVAALDPRDRTLLRYSLVDGVSIDRLAEMYGIHRATAARQVARARDVLVRATQDELRHALAVESETLDSILRLVESSADVSARRLLGAAPGG